MFIQRFGHYTLSPMLSQKVAQKVYRLDHGLEHTGFESRLEKIIFRFSKIVQAASWAHPASFSVGIDVLSRG